MTDALLIVHLVLAVVTLAVLGGVLLIWAAVKKNMPQAQFERLIASLEETKLSIFDMGRELQAFRQQLRKELDNLHERLEYLEEIERQRKASGR